MTVVSVLWGVYLALALVYWLYALAAAVRMRRLPRLGPDAAPAPAAWPTLSVIVPARNEAEALEPAARSLLASDYPALEVVFVDDRSTDSTGAIIDRLAAGDPRARALHLEALPEGWLGKVHALQRGLEASGGAWVLLTDADVHVAPGALRHAVAWCEARGLDHLAALPSLRPAGLLVDAAVGVFIRQFLMMMRPWAVADPRSRAFLGVGAFNLVRRSALEKTAGLAWLRMEVGDDAALGLLMKRSGARCGAATAFDQVGLTWYRSFGEAARGAEKGFATATGCSVLRSVVAALVLVATEAAPLLALVPLAVPGMRAWGAAGLAVAGLFALTTALVTRWARVRMLPALLGPVVAVANAAVFVRTGWLGWRRGGVLWRGTLYRTEALRAGQRLRLP